MKHYIFDLDDTIIVHRNNINYELIYENVELSHYLDMCRGLRYIYTNGNFSHAEEILDRMNITEKFSKVYSRDTLPAMKPHLSSALSVERDIIRCRVDSGASVYDIHEDTFVFFDDIIDNLRVAKRIGWTTVWIHPNHERGENLHFVDHAYPNLVEALRDLLR